MKKKRQTKTAVDIINNSYTGALDLGKGRIRQYKRAVDNIKPAYEIPAYELRLGFPLQEKNMYE